MISSQVLRNGRFLLGKNSTFGFAFKPQERCFRLTPLHKIKPAEIPNYELIANVHGVSREFQIPFIYLMKRIWRPRMNIKLFRNLIQLAQTKQEVDLLLLTWKEWNKHELSLDPITKNLYFNEIINGSSDPLGNAYELLANFAEYWFVPTGAQMNKVFALAEDATLKCIPDSNSSDDDKVEALKMMYKVFGLALFYGHLPTKKVYRKLIEFGNLINTNESKLFSAMTEEELTKVDPPEE